MRLTMEAGEKTVIIPSANQMKRERIRQFVVGKIFDSRVVNRDTLRTHLPRILQLRREADIEIVRDNIFAVDFTSDEDRKHALWDSPLHFFKSLMLFKETVGLQNPSDVKFDEFVTWIQLHNLPLACMQSSTVRSIGETVGCVEEVDTNENGSFLGQFARVRVKRELSIPLQRCVSIAMDGEEEQRIVLIRYERLPDFYFTCGRLGHVVRHCDDEDADKSNLGFGQWMRASRVLESRRQRSGPEFSRPWSENWAPSRKTSGYEETPIESEGSKASEGDKTEKSDNNNMQIVLFQREKDKAAEMGEVVKGADMEVIGEVVEGQTDCLAKIQNFAEMGEMGEVLMDRQKGPAAGLKVGERT